MKITIHDAERLAALPHILAMAADVGARLVDGDEGETMGVCRYDAISQRYQYFSLRRGKSSVAVWHHEQTK